jgi:hypothetical protein
MHLVVTGWRNASRTRPLHLMTVTVRILGGKITTIPTTLMMTMIMKVMTNINQSGAESVIKTLAVQLVRVR